VIAVARGSRLIVGEWVTAVFDVPGMQGMADRLPEASRYCTDGAEVYPEIIWPDAAWHVVSIAKEETYTIEGINADLRTYLGRLKRRSRCFSRSIETLREAVRLFVWHYNRRRRVINANPQYRDTLSLRF
jgi:insertion element IS1 protein InsB